jgi:alanine racemase/UDP-N-acetylmuramoyl-tripeptide--D-alanyl-D-alanine ligase
MDAFDLRQWAYFAQAGGNKSQPAIIDQIAIDSRRIYSEQALFVALKGEKLNGHHYVAQAAQAGAKYALVSQNFESSQNLNQMTLLRVADPLRAFQEIAKAYRLLLPIKIIGIAGSFGKTMVKDLLHALLSTTYKVGASPESFNSQIGVPLSLLTLRKEHEIGIIEASISHKNEMDYLADLILPDYTILTPIGKKHLATLENLPTIAHELMKLILKTSPKGWALLPKEPLLNHYPLTCAHHFWDLPDAKLPSIQHLNQDWILPIPYQINFPDSTIYQGAIQTGYTYFQNLLNMAVKSAWLMGISSEKIKGVLQNYQPESMRTEIWKSPLGTTFINDTYCSDPYSIDRALRHFHYAIGKQKKIFLFGGMRGNLQAVDYQRIGQALNKSSVDQIILFGNKPFDLLISELKHKSITHCTNQKEALEQLKLTIDPHDVVLIKGENKIPIDVLTEAFNDSLNNNQCAINFEAIRSNITTLQNKLPKGTRLMVIVKALAYGTDEVRMAKFLATCGIDILGVSYVDEAVALKRAGIQQTIFSINAAIYETNKVVKWDLEVGVSDSAHVIAIAEEAKKQDKKIKVHLHINTGMGRFGCRSEEALQLAQYIQNCPNLILEGIMTHFACAENAKEDQFTWSQIQAFDQVIEHLEKQGITPPWRHAANSSGAIRFVLPQYNMVRVGLATYGLYSSEESRQMIDLRLAISLTSRIVGINICKKGETISYGRSYMVEKEEQRVAVLPIGYFDGLHRNYSGKAYVLIRGKKAPMIGKICMDYMMVDVTDIPQAKVGDKVLVFGEDELGQYLSPEELALSGDSIIHELITCLGPRIQRVFVYEEGHQIR